MHLWDYPSISMFSPDLSSTVKWSSQTMIRSGHRFTRASPKASKRAGGVLDKILQLVDAGNLCVSGSSIDRTFFSLFPEFEDLVGNLVVKVLQEVNQHKLIIHLRLVTCSRHLNLTDFEVGASCSIALQGKAKTGYPRVSRGSFFIRLRIFSVLLCTFFIYSFSFFQNIDRRIHIPVHPVSTFA